VRVGVGVDVVEVEVPNCEVRSASWLRRRGSCEEMELGGC
jgi:hypothetical protein